MPQEVELGSDLRVKEITTYFNDTDWVFTFDDIIDPTGQDIDYAYIARAFHTTISFPIIDQLQATRKDLNPELFPACAACRYDAKTVVNYEDNRNISIPVLQFFDLLVRFNDERTHPIIASLSSIGLEYNAIREELIRALISGEKINAEIISPLENEFATYSALALEITLRDCTIAIPLETVSGYEGREKIYNSWFTISNNSYDTFCSNNYISVHLVGDKNKFPYSDPDMPIAPSSTRVVEVKTVFDPSHVFDIL